MPTMKLSKDAIKFIIQKREDGTKHNTFPDIRKMLIQEFDIDVVTQSVSRNYRKYKDNEEYRTPLIIESNNEDSLKDHKKENAVPEVPEVPKKLKSKRINEPIIPVIIQNDFDEDAGKNYDVNDFFMK